MNKPIAVVRLAASLLGTLALAACGASATRVEKARASAYQADYPLVWNAVLAALESEGYRLAVQDLDHGRMVTRWHLVESHGDALHGQDGASVLMFRAVVQIQGKQPPYKISVDAEAASWRPIFVVPLVFEHGSDDEPDWVEGRINRLYVEVLDQLEAYAVPAGAVQALKRPPPGHARH